MELVAKDIVQGGALHRKAACHIKLIKWDCVALRHC